MSYMIDMSETINKRPLSKTCDCEDVRMFLYL